MNEKEALEYLEDICPDAVKSFNHDMQNCEKCKVFWKKHVVPTLGRTEDLRKLGIIIDDKKLNNS